MTRHIYIATTEAGRGICHITRFNDRADLLAYADRVTAMRDSNAELKAGSTISEILDVLEDNGPGIGSRYHCRISHAEARATGLRITL